MGLKSLIGVERKESLAKLNNAKNSCKYFQYESDYWPEFGTRRGHRGDACFVYCWTPKWEIAA